MIYKGNDLFNAVVVSLGLSIIEIHRSNKMVKKNSLKVTTLGDEFESDDMSHIGSLDSAKSYLQK